MAKRKKNDGISFRGVLGIGKGNAIHQKDLASKYGTTAETIKANIQKQRYNGEPIISDGCGYWYADTEEEFQEWYQREKNEIRKRTKTVEAVYSAWKENWT